MVLLNMLGDFLLSEWLWGITFSWSYLPFTMVMMIIFLRRLLPMSLFRATILAISANGFALLVYSGIVVGLFIHVLQWWYVPQHYDIEIGPFHATLFLGLIYFVLHSCFFMLVHSVYRVNIHRLIIIALMSNFFSVIASYLYILFMTRNTM